MQYVVSFIRVLVSLLALGVGLIVLHHFLSNDPGTACAQDFECRQAWNGVCLHVTGVDPYCSRKCTTAADCPASWSCEAITTERMTRGVRSTSHEDSACVRSVPTAPSARTTE